jgi:hypothetical protein
MSVFKWSGTKSMVKQTSLVLLIAIALIVSPANLSGQGKNKSRGKQASVEGEISAGAASSSEVARALVLTESFDRAISAYAMLLKNDSANVSLNSEYAYALALAGIYDAAISRLDRIWNQRGNSPDAGYYASQVFALMGYDRLAGDLAGVNSGTPAPDWIAAKAPGFLLKYGRRPTEDALAVEGDAMNSFKRANRLTAQGYYLKSSALFEEITAQYPDEVLPYVGYSIALERAGMLNPSARTIEKALTVAGNTPEMEETRRMLDTRLTSLKTRIGTEVKPVSPVGTLLTKTGDDSKRLIAYAGGMFAKSFISVNGRFGIVKKGMGNTSMDLGVIRSGGATALTLGLTNYSRSKAFVAGYGLQGSFGGGGTALNLKISVGLSFMNSDKSGSWDIFLDGYQRLIPKDGVTTVGMSIGRSVYFGKR